MSPRVRFVLRVLVGLSVSAGAVVAQATAALPLARVDLPVPISRLFAFGDLDGDGDPDGIDGPGLLWINDGFGRFGSVTPAGLSFPQLLTAPPAVAATAYGSARIADLDGDGFGDVLQMKPSGPWQELRIEFGGPGYVFTPATAFPLQVPGSPPTFFGFLGAVVPMSFDVGDVDQDGDLDILLSTYGLTGLNGPISIGFGGDRPLLWLNDGNRGFVPSLGGALGQSRAPYARAFLRDVDQDGDLDAFFGGDTNPAVPPRLCLNDGSGTFVDAPSQAAPPPGAGVARCELGDFDGDGRLDLVQSTITAVHVAYGVAGGFGPSTITTGVAYGTPIALDVDADQNDELLILRGPAEGFQVSNLYAVGGGTATTSSSFPAMLGAVFPLTPDANLLDADGDGDRDVLLACGGFLLNDGQGGLAPLVARGAPSDRLSYGLLSDVLYLDENQDGLTDVLGRDLQAAISDGEGGFVFQPSTGMPSPYGFASGFTPETARVAADFDLDGDLDVYVSIPGVTVPGFVVSAVDMLLERTPAGFVIRSTLPSTWSTSLAPRLVFDFDDDGFPDVLAAQLPGPFPFSPLADPPMLLIRNLGAAAPPGAAPFAPPVPVGDVHATYELLPGDFDGDGDLDFLQLNGVANVLPDDSVLYLQQSGGMVAVQLPGIHGPLGAAADFDGDGDADLVVGDRIYWFQGGLPTAGPLLPVPAINRLSAADFDGDGLPDLLETPAAVARNLSTAGFGPFVALLPRKTSSSYLLNPQSTATDLDRDGDLDVLAPGPVAIPNVVRHLTAAGVVAPGRKAGVNLFGKAGGTFLLFAALATAEIDWSPYGRLAIDPATALLMDSGAFGANGKAGFSFTVPQNPLLAGLSVYWQAFDSSAGRLTGRLTTAILDV